MMKKPAFNSLFAQRISAFVAEKKSLGFSYDYAYVILKTFDTLCVEQFPEETSLTKELFTVWAKRRKTENGIEQNQTMRVRHSILREFAKYLITTGESAYVLPTKIVRFGHKPVPYVLSEEEIVAIWSAADKLKPKYNSPYRHITLPVLFRVIYCCGLRPQEIRRLETSDIDLNIGKIFVRESKGRKDRIVMMSDDVCALCREYDERINVLLPGRKYFFPHTGDNSMLSQTLFDAFKDLWLKAGFSRENEHHPTVYSFRHSMATHRLYKWMREGKDLTAMLPNLSAYLGHKNLSNTYYYIHFAPGIFESMSGADYSELEKLIPEVRYE